MKALRSSERLARWAYTALYIPAAPFIFGYWMTRPDSRSRLGEYLGRGADARSALDGTPAPILVHAVSAGEAVAVSAVLRGLQDEGHEFFLTTTIQDALETAKGRGITFQGSSFFPLDVPAFQGRLLDRLKPVAAIISETDLWPNSLLALRKRGIPTYLVNGRVSPKLAKGWERMRPWLGEAALGAFRKAFVQGNADKKRLVQMGVPEDRILVTGNTKYDMGAPPALPPEYESLHSKIRNSDRPLVVAGSTHAPEEGYLLKALFGAPGAPPRLLLVPRATSRASEVLDLARSEGKRAGLWSELARMKADPEPYDVLVVDVMGQLSSLYQGAAVAYIGGGFGNLGGHNFLEAAYHRVPLMGGPNFFNFAADIEVFQDAGVFFPCPHEEAVQEILWALLGEQEGAKARGQRGRDLLDRGATASAKIVKEILSDLEEHPGPGQGPDFLT